MSKPIRWRLHCAASPETIYDFWTTDAGRERFWAERSAATDDGFRLQFIDGTEAECRVLAADPPSRFAFTYFGSQVDVTLEPDGRGGTDLTLLNEGVAEEEHDEVHAGWLNVLLPLKAAADFGVDLRNHDPHRTWRDFYVDQ